MLEMYLNDAMNKEPMDDGYKPSEEGSIQPSVISVQTQKILRDGQILIQRGAVMYDVLGRQIGR